MLSGTARLHESYIEAAWELGKAQVDRYDSTRGGAWYLAKTYGEPSEYWEPFNLSRHMPARRLVRAAA